MRDCDENCGHSTLQDNYDKVRAYIDGIRAWEEGEPHKNPYNNTHHCYSAWEMGWNAAAWAFPDEA